MCKRTKIVNLSYAIGLLPMSLSFAVTTSQKTDLTVQVRGFSHQKSRICYALFANEIGFPHDISRAESVKCIPISDAEEKSTLFAFKIQNVQASGLYCLSLFQDTNDDSALNKNFLGIPKERFGFSRNPTIRLGPPKFSSCSFKVPAPTNSKVDELQNVAKDLQIELLSF